MCRSIHQPLLRAIGLYPLESDGIDESNDGATAEDFADVRFAVRESELESKKSTRRATDRTDGPRTKGRDRKLDERAGRQSYTKGGRRRETDRHYSDPVELIDALTLARTAYGRSDD